MNNTTMEFAIVHAKMAELHDNSLNQRLDSSFWEKEKPRQNRWPWMVAVFFLAAAMLFAVQPISAASHFENANQIAQVDALRQEVDVNDDGVSEHFAANISVFDDGRATGTIEIGDAYLVKVERGVATQSAGQLYIYGSLYHVSDIDTAELGQITIALEQREGDGRDIPDSILWDLDGVNDADPVDDIADDEDSSELQEGGGDDLPDTILWDLNGGSVDAPVYDLADSEDSSELQEGGDDTPDSILWDFDAGNDDDPVDDLADSEDSSELQEGGGDDLPDTILWDLNGGSVSYPFESIGMIWFATH